MAVHPPGEGFAIVFTDKTGQERSEESIALLVERLQEAAEIHGFKWSQYGTRSQVRKSLHDEQDSIDRQDLAEMLAEHRRQRAEREDTEE